MTKDKIIIGATQYDVVPLTLGVLRQLGVESARFQAANNAIEGDIDAKEDVWYTTAYTVIAHGLGWYKEVDGKQVPDVARVENMAGGTLQQIMEAQRTVYRVAGLIPGDAEDKKPSGEGATG